MRPIALALLAGTSLALAGCGAPAQESDDAATGDAALSAPSAAASPSPSASVAAAGGTVTGAAPDTFNQCKACHAVEPDKHGIGPSLAGVFGTKAGDIPGFPFSDAMKESGLTWDDATLDRYLENPRGVVPGTTMSFMGIKDPVKRKAVVDYVKTL